MRYSDFRERLDTTFGSGYGPSLASDLVIGSLGGRTADEALRAGVAPRDVWVELCDAMEVPEASRWATATD